LTQIPGFSPDGFEPNTYNPVSWVFAAQSQQTRVDSSWTDSLMRRFGRKTTNRYFTATDLLNYRSKHTGEGKSRNHFPYTGDIGIGNTFIQYGTGKGDVGQGHYVCYIHSSLKLAKIISSIPSAGPNKYTKITADNVKKFQAAYGLAYVDGVVDSETKSAFAYLWSNTKENGTYSASIKEVEKDYKNNPAFLKSVLKYIEAGMLADHIGSAKRGQISRITYTDSRLTPDKIIDTFYIAIPDICLGKEINSMSIKTGTVCGCTVTGITFTAEDFNANLGEAKYKELNTKKGKVELAVVQGATNTSVIGPGENKNISITGVLDRS